MYALTNRSGWRYKTVSIKGDGFNVKGDSGTCVYVRYEILVQFTMEKYFGEHYRDVLRMKGTFSIPIPEGTISLLLKDGTQ